MIVTAREELVAALLDVPGVAAAAVEPADDGPGTLRLQLQPGVDEVSVAGEVNHLLRDRFGLAVDTDRVRVVEPAMVPGTGARMTNGADPAMTNGSEPATAPSPLPAPGRANPPPAWAGRVVIERLQLVSAGLSTTVVVTLAGPGGTYDGQAQGTATTGSLHRAVASATLHALETMVDGRARFDVEHVELAETGEDETALVVVTMVTDRAVQRLSGASVVRGDARQAVIRAVLAAVNRRIAPTVEQTVR